ncbi:MAG: hypothetical protein J5644_10180 [Bacteroidales bacterium]|nr:hypothetical protein [Bacteroidales bacterium]
MKRTLILLLTVVFACCLFSCNKGEGEGGSATIEGKVYAINHPDDNYTLETDTMAAVKTDVFIIYGDDTYFGDDVETDQNGHYRFKYLKPGNYTILAYSTYPNGRKEAVTQTVTVKRGITTTVPDIYIHQGKALGTSIIKGKVIAFYINKDGDIIGTGPAYEHRMYLQRANEPYFIDDTRVGIDGIFAFQKVEPGEYIVFTTSSSTDGNEIPGIVQKTVSIENAGEIVTIEESFIVYIKP